MSRKRFWLAATDSLPSLSIQLQLSGEVAQTIAHIQPIVFPNSEIQVKRFFLFISLDLVCMTFLELNQGDLTVGGCACSHLVTVATALPGLEAGTNYSDVARFTAPVNFAKRP